MSLDRDTQVYNNYGQSVIGWAAETIKPAGRAIPWVFASPERAFAQLVKRLPRRPREAPVDGPHQHPRALSAVPLPFGSLSMTGIQPDPERFNTEHLTKLKRDVDWTKYVGCAFPRAVKLMYQLSLWARLLEDLQAMLNQVLLSYHGPLFYVTVSHPEPIGDLIVPVFITTTTPETIVEQQSDGERALRWAIPLTVDGWLIYPADETAIVRSIEVDYYDMEADGSPGDLLGSTTVSA